MIQPSVQSLYSDLPPLIASPVRFVSQSVKRLSVHVFRFEQDRLKNTSRCVKPSPYLLSLPNKPGRSAFLLACINKVVAVAAQKIFSGPVKHGHSFPAVRTEKPYPAAAVVARGAVKRDRLFNLLPFSAVRTVSVMQDHPVFFHCVTDRAGLSAATRPRQRIRCSGTKPVVFLHPSNIDVMLTVRGALL